MLRPLQNLFDPADHPNLLVGLGVPDDAAVYRLADDQALIFTTDFFTPIVDDPYDYGSIAAANSLSDVYAMGGRPIMALNIAAFPTSLPLDILTEIIRGSAEKVREAGAVIAGGHTIRDDEPKVGLAVVGMAHPDRLMTKAGAQPGDVLALTKPLGSGVITTAGKGSRARAEHIAGAVRWMAALSRHASEAALAAGARCATDITGFGFMGHATEVAEASGVTLHVKLDAVPLMDGAADYAEEWLFPGGSADNMRAYQSGVRFEGPISEEQKMLLFDAQTSGGLLIAVPAAGLARFEAEMAGRQAPWWRIGEVLPRGDFAILVTA
ncbi:MAG: selenide, water dikinase SelD [Anaerolineae bacterium]